jgi:6-pyruvoyltetrahydropterin/6-carboxytetrahydropterin synthase
MPVRPVARGEHRSTAVYLRRTYRFCCSHRYHNPRLSEEENRLRFGKCNFPHGHGHNYELVVVLGPGLPDPATGMLFDLGELDRIVSEAILEPFDHRHLNLDVPHFADVIPTTEEIARYAFDVLDRALPDTLLDRVVIREDESLAAECVRPPDAR